MEVDKKDLAAGALGGGAGVTGSAGAVYLAGTTLGVSGPGIMSGLAAIGGVVGGGALAGVVVLSAAPIAGAAATWGIYRYFKND